MSWRHWLDHCNTALSLAGQVDESLTRYRGRVLVLVGRDLEVLRHGLGVAARMDAHLAVFVLSHADRRQVVTQVARWMGPAPIWIDVVGEPPQALRLTLGTPTRLVVLSADDAGLLGLGGALPLWWPTETRLDRTRFHPALVASHV